MALFPDTKDLVAFSFETDVEINTCIDLYLEIAPEGYISFADDRTVIVSRQYASRLMTELGKKGYKPKSSPDVVSSGDLPAEEAADVRAARGRVPGWNIKDDIKKLTEKYQLE